jgi:wyosine [tRNA(Phe)-imidazoG37] synthetase (radical SAM superfamily)|tara:strand:+ start:560 stop:838 length:279 start_codon:yes stop_codon:yes gene_type:complete
MTTFLVITIIVLKILLAFTVYSIRTLTRQAEALEESNDQYVEWFLNFKKEIDKAAIQLKQVDRKGSFEADDEIGFIFKEVKKIQGRLNEYFG